MINRRGWLVVCLWTVFLVSVSLAHDNPEDWSDRNAAQTRPVRSAAARATVTPFHPIR